MNAEQLAQRFHETYERLAPAFGYETRKECAKPWAEVPAKNRKLMTAVCAELREAILKEAAAATHCYKCEVEIERLTHDAL